MQLESNERALFERESLTLLIYGLERVKQKTVFNYIKML